MVGANDGWPRHNPELICVLTHEQYGAVVRCGLAGRVLEAAQARDFDRIALMVADALLLAASLDPP